MDLQVTLTNGCMVMARFGIRAEAGGTATMPEYSGKTSAGAARDGFWRAFRAAHERVTGGGFGGQTDHCLPSGGETRVQFAPPP